jgi:hypothetical protein
MTCDRIQELVDAWVDGDIDAAQRDALDAHAATCEACAALMADLRRVRQTASTLDRLTPPPRVWTRLEQQLAAEPRFREAAARRGAGLGSTSASRAGGWNWRSPVLALAASLLLAVAGSLYLLHRWTSPATPAPSGITASGGSSGSGATTGTATQSSQGGTQPGNAQPGAIVESIDSELQQAAAHYEKAIAGLEQVANASDSPLDPDVLASLHRSLGVIDKAIDESRVAIKAHPENRIAQQSLFDSFRRKVALLQDTIALMNELRKGDQAGAARVASGLNKS